MLESGSTSHPLEVKRLRILCCPKCAIFLPELSELGIYRCGSCNTTLQAKHSASLFTSSSKKSDTERMLHSETAGIQNTKERYQSNNIDRSAVSKLDGDRDTVLNGSKENPPIVLAKALLPLPSTEGDDQSTEKVEVSPNAIVPIGIYRDSGGHSDSNMDEIGDGKRLPHIAPQAEVHEIQASPVDEGSLMHPSHSGFKGHHLHPGDFESEILRKIDELKDQLTQMRMIKSKKSGNLVAPSRSAFANNSQEISNLGERQSPKRYPSNSHIRRVPPTRELVMYKNSQELLPAYGYGLYHQSPSRYKHYAPSTHLHGPFDPVPSMSYANDMFPHASTCMHCQNNHLHTPHHSPKFSGNTWTPSRDGTHGPYTVNSQEFRNMGHKTENRKSSWNSHGSRNRRKFSSSAPARHQNIAGGAPYFVCNGCLELLKLPSHIVWKQDQAKLRCGGCSQVIVVAVNQNQIRVVKSAENGQPTDGLKHQTLLNNESFLDSAIHGPSGKNVPIVSKDVGMPQPPFSVSKESSEKGRLPDLGKPSKQVGSSRSVSNDGSPKTELYDQYNNVDDADADDELEGTPRQKPTATNPHVGGLDSADNDPPDGDGFDDTPTEQGVIKYIFGTMPGISKRGIVIPVNSLHRKVPATNASSATELELSPNEYPKDSSHGSPTEKKDNYSPIAVAPENNDELHSTQSPTKGKSRVSINGHPLSDRNVVKATEKAGPIQSGDYWYDGVGGFWGLMGQPCLGIIPPGIEEFNFPMPNNCCGGNTGVEVNGRELHEKDLELLVGRGLPSSTGRSYIIEISGRVQDSATGEDLGSLGKLAPTVERLGHGFGMRAPRTKSRT